MEFAETKLELSPIQIDNLLLMYDVGGRFDGDIEFLTLVLKEEQTFEGAKRARELLRNSGVQLGFHLRGD